MTDTTKRDAVVEESTRDVGDLWPEIHELSQAIKRVRHLTMDQRVTIMRLVEEVKRLGAAVERVRALHISSVRGGFGECDECVCDYPCPTLRALDGEA